MEFETIIGLEIHAELSTKSKMFCGCSTEFGGEPNTRTCPVCLGHPGTLPVANRKAIEYTILLGLALNCEIARRSLFHRKNYFYPDMPKNYQISQYDIPLSKNGFLEIDMGDYKRKVGITRVHLEEDTGKSIHVGESGRIHGAGRSLEDFNRAGIPLVEIVTEPDLRTPEEARNFMIELRAMLEYLGISDCKMEEGSLRCDANISIAVDGVQGTKVEIKNMNSFRALQRALSFEEKRQKEIIIGGGKIPQETRHWDEAAGVTHTLRTKEEAFDYRYFPEPDLVPLEPDPQIVEELQKSLPETPGQRLDRFIRKYGLPKDTARVLVYDKKLGDFYEEAVAKGGNPVAIAKWLAGDFVGLLNEFSIKVENSPIGPHGISELILLVERGVISGRMAKDVLKEAFQSGESPAQIVSRKGLSQIADSEEIALIVERVVDDNPQAVRDFLEGKEQALKFLMGQVMKLSRGKANPTMASEKLRELLEKRQ